MGADYSICVKFIATRAPTLFGYIISVLAYVHMYKIYIEIPDRVGTYIKLDAMLQK